MEPAEEDAEAEDEAEDEDRGGTAEDGRTGARARGCTVQARRFAGR
jgi:hypothetical protein